MLPTIEEKQESVSNDIDHLRVLIFIKQQLHNKLSETIINLMRQGHKQKYIAKLVGLDQPKVSCLRKNEKLWLADSNAIRILRVLGVYCIIDTGKAIPDVIKFYSR